METTNKQAWLNVERDYQSTIQTLNIDSEHARATIEEQAEFVEQRTHIEATLRGQLNLSTVREVQAAELASSHQQKLRENDLDFR